MSNQKIITLSKKLKIYPTPDQRAYFNEMLSMKAYFHNALLSSFIVVHPYLNREETLEYFDKNKTYSVEEIYDKLDQIYTDMYYRKYKSNFDDDKPRPTDDATRDFINEMKGHHHTAMDKTKSTLKRKEPNTPKGTLPTTKQYENGTINMDHFLNIYLKYYSLSYVNLYKSELQLAKHKCIFEKYKPNIMYLQTQNRQAFLFDFCTTIKRHFDVVVSGKITGMPHFVGGKRKVRTVTIKAADIDDQLFADSRLSPRFLDKKAKCSVSHGVRRYMVMPQAQSKLYHMVNKVLKCSSWCDSFDKIKGKSTKVFKDDKNEFYLIIPYEMRPKDISQPKEKVGIDPGIATMLTLYDGVEFHEIQSPNRVKRLEIRRVKLQEKLKSKIKGSINWQKLAFKIKKLYKKIADIKMDFNHKISKRIVTTYKECNYETPNVEEWKTDHKSERNKKIQIELNLGQFSKFLLYKYEKYNSKFREISGFEGATQTCSNSKCGTINKLTITDRIYNCVSCGLSIGRDKNAAINIYKHTN